MVVGIIIHSETGNTLSVGECIRDALLINGHEVNIERVRLTNEKPAENSTGSIGNFDLTKYDWLIFGAPVNGFSLSKAMQSYVSQLPDQSGLKTCCFVTQYFPKPWMGGNRAVQQFVQLCSAKSLSIQQTGVINWSAKSRENQIAQLINNIIVSMK